jgi:hypothetical protein
VETVPLIQIYFLCDTSPSSVSLRFTCSLFIVFFSSVPFLSEGPDCAPGSNVTCVLTIITTELGLLATRKL